MLACQAGKDVYVENRGYTMTKARMVTAAQKHNRIVQMGSQWKSCQHIIDAAAFVNRQAWAGEHGARLGVARLATGMAACG